MPDRLITAAEARKALAVTEGGIDVPAAEVARLARTIIDQDEQIKRLQEAVETARRLAEIGERRGYHTLTISKTLKPALETVAGMKEEWGVEIGGKIPGTWYQLNLNGIAPDHYADAAWLETREEAESLKEDVLEGEWYGKARLIHRYVTAHQATHNE